MPNGEGDCFRNLNGLVNAFKKSKLSLFSSFSKSLSVRIDEVEGDSEPKKIGPNIKHIASI